MAEHLSPAQQLSFVAAKAVATVEDYLRSEDVRRLRETCDELIRDELLLPPLATDQPLKKLLGLLIFVLGNLAVAKPAWLNVWTGFAIQVAWMVKKAHREFREGAAS